MLIENPEVFRHWLTTVLEPLCDADPAALAKYVYALVKKDKPVNELRESMIDQLDVFLQQETKSFVALLFKTIENKEYLNAKKDAGKEEDKKKLELNESKNTVQPAALPPLNDEQVQESSKEKEKEKDDNEDVISSTDEKQNANSQIQSSVVSEGTVKLPDDKTGDRKRETEREERFRLNRSRIRKESSIPRTQRSRSRSWERGDRTRRSRSRDRERDRDNRVRERERARLYRNKSPPRRYERGFDRRRSYSRSPSTARYRPATSLSPSKSPKHRGRFRNRSPPGSHSRSRSRSRSRSFERKKSPVGRDARDDTPTQDSNHGDVDMRLSSTVREHGLTSGGNRRCRDFDEKGYCMRGDLCPYDHGTDPVVLEDLALSQVLTFGPQNPPGPPLQRPPHHDMVHPMGPMGGMPPPPGVGPLPLGPPPHHMMQAPPPPLMLRPPPNMEYSPDAPGINPGMNWGRPPFQGRGPPRGLHPPPSMGFPPTQRELINVPVEGHPYHNSHMAMDNHGHGHGHGDSRKNVFDSTRLPGNCCLVIRKVPPGLNNITHLNNHFAKFGKIVNIQVNFDTDPEAAMVTFSSPAEANAAIKSTEAVLNNRFIKVFWHNDNKPDFSKPGNHIKDRLGHQVGQQGMGASSGVPHNTSVLVTNTSLKKTSINTEQKKKETVEEKKAKTIAAIKKSQEILEKNKLLRTKTEEKRKEALKLTSDLRKRSQNLLEKQIEQQKELIKKLETGNLDAKQKAEMKQTIQMLQEAIEKMKKELLESTKPVKKPAPVRKTKEEIQKEILDTELDIMTKQQEGGDVTLLQRKVTLLKLEMTRLQPKLAGPRSLARAMPLHKAQGHPMSLNRTLVKKGAKTPYKTNVDHRPTKLLVSGYENDEKDQVLAHFRQYGEIGDYISDDSTPSMVLNFKTRQEAESAMAKGKNFQDRLLTVTWFTNSNMQSRRRNSSVNGPTYHMHAGRQVLLSGSETDLDNDGNAENDESEIDHALESSEDLLLQDDDDDLEDEERSWRR